MIMKNETIAGSHCGCKCHLLKRISWTAILVGTLVAVGLSFLLNLFGIAIGLSAVTLGKNGAITLAAGGLLSIIISTIASMLAAGYVAGYLGRLHCPQRNLGIVYGFTTWSLALIFSVVIGAQISTYVVSYSNAISHSVFVTSQDKSHPFGISTPPINTDQTVSNEAVVPATNLTYGAFIVFVIFFLGALSSCLGACWGMSCKRDD